MQILKTSWKFVFSLLSGFLLALCFPGYGIGGFVWIWAIPLMVALWCGDVVKAKRKSFLLGWVSGFLFWMMTVNWLLAMGDLDDVPVVGAWFAWIGLSFYLAIYIGVWSMFLATVGNPWKQVIDDDEADQKVSRIDQRIAEKLASQKQGGKKKFKVMSGFGESMRVMRFAVMHASLWVVLEWMRGWLFTGFTWNGLGIAFHDTPTIAQSADLVGVVGLSFLPILICSMMVQLGKRLIDEARDGGKFKAHWEIVFTIGLVILSFLYGMMKLGEYSQLEKHEVKVLLLQSNISQNQKHGDEEQQLLNYAWFAAEKERAFNQLNQEAINKSVATGEPQVVEKPDLVVLPESALTYGLCYVEEPQNWFFWQAEDIVKDSLLADGDHSLVFGSNFYEAEISDVGMGSQLGIILGKDYNAIALAGARQKVILENGDINYTVSDMNIYGKVHLVPFGEYFPDIPFREFVYTALYGSNPSMSFTKGESFDSLPLEVEEQKIGVIPAVCFEDSVGRVTRKFVKNEAQMIVNVTNDGWFGQSKAAVQHMANARFRTIELRRPMVRCANTGVSCVIDITGSLIDDVTGEQQILVDENESIFTAGHLLAYARVPVEPQWTLYALLGDWFVILCAFIFVGLSVLGRFKF